MRFLGRVLFIVPLSVHIGYLAATFPELATMVGHTAKSAGLPKSRFALLWCLTIALANIVFIAVYWIMPKMKDSMLRVPGAIYWLSCEERRTELVARLRGVVEVSLLGLNLFFFAVYQSIYQANALAPAVSFQPAVLIIFFMIAPILMILVWGVLVIRGIALDASEPDE